MSITDDINHLIGRLNDAPRSWAPISGSHLNIKFSERELESLVKALQTAAALQGSVAVSAEDRPHRLMTSEEYAALRIIGPHLVCKDFEGELGSVALWYIATSVTRNDGKDGAA
jgi:hypothetical protein